MLSAQTEFPVSIPERERGIIWNESIFLPQSRGLSDDWRTLGICKRLSYFLVCSCAAGRGYPVSESVALLFGVCWLIRDYQKWRKLKIIFRIRSLFGRGGKKILGEELYGYVCKIQEEQQKEAAEYTRRLGELSDYIARWSHEAKLPLTSLKLMNQRNQDTGLKRDMQDCIMRLEGLIHTVLTGSKLQQPQHDVRMEKLTLESVVKEAVKNQSYFLIQYQFELELDLQGISVYSDRRWLVYLLNQLVGNAVKYRKDEPKLSFRAKGKKKV